MKTLITKSQSGIMLSCLALIMIISTAASVLKPDFTGEWTLDEGKSSLGEYGAMMSAQTLSVKQEGDVMTIVRNQSNQMGTSVTTDKLTADGKESPSTGGREGSTRTASLKPTTDGNSMQLKAVTTMEMQGNAFQISTDETWTLSEDGKLLTINSNTSTTMGDMGMKQVYTKK